MQDQVHNEIKKTKLYVPQGRIEICEQQIRNPTNKKGIGQDPGSHA